MPVTVTIRPSGARTEIRGLPWTGRPGDAYEALEEAIDASRQGQVQYSRRGRYFSVARSHTHDLITYLAERYGQVHVIQHGGLTKCVSACWTADPGSAWECECSCAGSNHGSGHAIGRVVAEGGPTGDLSVGRLGPREWDVYGSDL